MQALLPAFIFGAVVGSFLNVLTLRYGVRSLSGRSQCPSCGKTLSWRELVPVLSFFVQRGRCRSCKGRISWQYPFVELLTGVVFAAAAWKEFSALSSLSFSSAASYLLSVASWSLLIALSVYDLRHKIIPDAFVYPFLFLAFLRLSASCFMFPAAFPTSCSLDFWGGPLLAFPFAALWFLSRGRAMGLGDAKLALGFSPFVGFLPAVSAVVLGFWAGAAVALPALFLKAASERLPGFLPPRLSARLKLFTMKSELPLGPFLVFGLFIAYMTGVDVVGLSAIMKQES